MKKRLLIISVLLIVCCSGFAGKADLTKERIVAAITDTVQHYAGRGLIARLDSVVLVSIDTVNEKQWYLYHKERNEELAEMYDKLVTYQRNEIAYNTEKANSARTEEERNKHQEAIDIALKGLPESARALRRYKEATEDLKLAAGKASTENPGGYFVRTNNYIVDNEQKSITQPAAYLVSKEIEVTGFNRLTKK